MSVDSVILFVCGLLIPFSCHQTLCLGKKMQFDRCKILEYSHLLGYSHLLFSGGHRKEWLLHSVENSLFSLTLFKDLFNYKGK